MLSRIQALHYRCFRDLDVSLPQYSVLAGGNGSGKSTLMDIPLLFSDMLSLNNLVQAFLEPSPSTGSARAQRLQGLVHCCKGDSFGFALEALRMLLDLQGLSVWRNLRTVFTHER